ncbi:PaaI family thioesterase [Paenibacillus thermotolerans]|uniref:PaaI family thioesterase n=1 Tax=Paenibacillus thermotolerans TaxID=3027807 RepID=UPI0023688575|nr:MULTISPECIES: PaaI family thioesterase [unclassified Paenibacillus]
MDHTKGSGSDGWLAAMEERAKGTFWEHIGFKAEEVTAQRTVITLVADRRHLNPIGLVHGGVLSSMLDNAMGLAVMAARPGEKTVTTNLNVHFVAPLHEGKLTAVAYVQHESRTTLTVQGTVTDERGRLGTIGTGSFRILGAG